MKSRFIRLLKTAVAWTALTGSMTCGHSAEKALASPPGTPVQTLTVTNSNSPIPFTYRQKPLAAQTAWASYRLEFPSPVTTELPQNNTVLADLYVPADWSTGQSGRPAVICLPILNGDEDLTAMMCTVLASRGLVSVTFTLPYYGPRGPAEGRRALASNPRLFLSSLDQAGKEIARLVDLLQARPEVNPTNIGIAGISLGGIMSATAAGMDPRLHRAMLMLAGGDLTKMIHHARETRPLSRMIQNLPPEERVSVEKQLLAFDPLTHAPALRERAQKGRVLMLNAAQDEIIPRECTEKLANALGLSNKVIWFEGLGHYTALAELPRALRTMADFFASDLPSEAQRQRKTAALVTTNNYHRLMGVLQQVVTMATIPPPTGRCHYVEGELTGVDPSGRSLSGSGRIVIGHGPRFSFQMAAPGLGEWMAGHQDFPWLRMHAQSQDMLFAGMAGQGGEADWTSWFDSQHRMKLSLLQGLAATLIMAPDLLQRWVTAEFDANGWLCVTPKEERYRDAALRIKFQPDGITPEEIQAEVKGYDITFSVLGWQANTLAADPLFEPPPESSKQVVDGAALSRDFAGILNYLGDQVKVGKPAATTTNNIPLPRLSPADFIQRYRNLK